MPTAGGHRERPPWRDRRRAGTPQPQSRGAHGCVRHASVWRRPRARFVPGAPGARAHAPRGPAWPGDGRLRSGRGVDVGEVDPRHDSRVKRLNLDGLDVCSAMRACCGRGQRPTCGWQPGGGDGRLQGPRRASTEILRDGGVRPSHAGPEEGSGLEPDNLGGRMRPCRHRDVDATHPSQRVSAGRETTMTTTTGMTLLLIRARSKPLRRPRLRPCRRRSSSSASRPTSCSRWRRRRGPSSHAVGRRRIASLAGSRPCKAPP